MNLIDEVAKLKELEAQVDLEKSDVFDIDLGYISKLVNVAPELLAVLSGFRAGDRQILDLFVTFMEHFKPDGHLNDSGPGANITNAEAAACLRRYRDMAQAMEEHESHS
jgi:hypothetical protein